MQMANCNNTNKNKNKYIARSAGLPSGLN